mgnify:CR=1 FL=1
MSGSWILILGHISLTQVFNLKLDAEGESVDFNITPLSNNPFLRIALSWLDLPGEPGSFPLLTNDLDMNVSG